MKPYQAGEYFQLDKPGSMFDGCVYRLIWIPGNGSQWALLNISSDSPGFWTYGTEKEVIENLERSPFKRVQLSWVQK